MVGVIDIGNHNVHLGLYQGKRLCSSCIYPGSDPRCAERIADKLRAKSVTGCAVASVVPHMARSIKARIRAMTGLNPVMVTHRTASGLRFTYQKPATLGADRIANVLGGLARYDQNVIAIDCGTAITIDIGLKPDCHAGGVIMPGMHIMFNALTANAVQLKNIRYQRPRRLIGNSTESCMRSGVYFGALHAIEGMVSAFRREIEKPCVCVATGGWGRIVTRCCSSIDRYDGSLTLYGILLVYMNHVRNSP
ncbi:type III pantothenate kinase [candidate division WOR-3 bacterium]|nr:type III pantothenate kinase [candidate division WOR-3 bacterium]